MPVALSPSVTERKNCVHCGRSIDAGAKLCPFCSKDQAAPVVALSTPATAEQTANLRGSIDASGSALMILGVIVLLIGVFAVGTLVLGLNGRRETTRTNAGE